MSKQGVPFEHLLFDHEARTPPALFEAGDRLGQRAWYVVLPVTGRHGILDGWFGMPDTLRVNKLPRVATSSSGCAMQPDCQAFINRNEQGQLLLLLKGQDPEVLIALGSLLNADIAVNLLELWKQAPAHEVAPALDVRAAAHTIFGKQGV